MTNLATLQPFLIDPTMDDKEPIQITEEIVLTALARGKMREQGALPYSSNHSFLVTVTEGDLTLPAVYKPQRGETPLYDFEWGTLCNREFAAFMISQVLGWASCRKVYSAL